MPVPDADETRNVYVPADGTVNVCRTASWPIAGAVDVASTVPPAFCTSMTGRSVVLGVANSVAAVLPGMLQRGCGHLVAISSLASFRGLPLMAGYCAAKSGVNALMDSLRVEDLSLRQELWKSVSARDPQAATTVEDLKKKVARASVGAPTEAEKLRALVSGLQEHLRIL